MLFWSICIYTPAIIFNHYQQKELNSNMKYLNDEMNHMNLSMNELIQVNKQPNRLVLDNEKKL